MYREGGNFPSTVEELLDKLQAERKYLAGKAGTRKGKLAEIRSLNAAENLCSQHKWLWSARLSTNDEDARGIDLVVESQVGHLYVQIKSSRGGARSFRRKRRRCKAIVVIVHPEMSDAKLENKLFGALCHLRKRWRRRKRN